MDPTLLLYLQDGLLPSHLSGSLALQLGPRYLPGALLCLLSDRPLLRASARKPRPGRCSEPLPRRLWWLRLVHLHALLRRGARWQVIRWICGPSQLDLLLSERLWQFPTHLLLGGSEHQNLQRILGTAKKACQTSESDLARISRRSCAPCTALDGRRLAPWVIRPTHESARPAKLEIGLRRSSTQQLVLRMVQRLGHAGIAANRRKRRALHGIRGCVDCFLVRYLDKHTQFDACACQRETSAPE